ncbi:hypothetical protein E8E13_001512 [Curvularia kusanoi]|uniref:Uncharacterized protein n=1 Tax=Curvularia kusanoi TaxID=90978 RepID=A0A9P4T5M7_CURKU|nr:hypothetical protein E8E13_001512 [Curvularia kusanoi]
MGPSKHMWPKPINTLGRVRDALEKSTCQHASLFLSLMDSGKNHSLKCNPPVRIVFGPEARDFPSLGRKISPFYGLDLPALETLRELLVDDIQVIRHELAQNGSKISQSSETSIDLADDEVTLLDGLVDADKEIECEPWSFPSQSLDRICSRGGNDFNPEIWQSTIEAAILPRDKLIDLHYSNEGATITTLVSGETAWYIWPPTERNLNVLQKWYEDIASGSHNIKDTDVAMELEGGVILVQTAGEALRIPPYCPILCLPLKTSLLATYRSVASNQVIDMLNKLPLWLARFRTENDGGFEKRELAATILQDLKAILEDALESAELKNLAYPSSGYGPIHSLMRGWDRVKLDMAILLDPTEGEQLVTLWSRLLKNVKGRDCCICGDRIIDKINNAQRHFESKHWVSEVDKTVAGEHDEEARIAGSPTFRPN